MLSTINKFHSKFSPCISGILKTSHQQFCHGLKFHCFWVVITIIFRYITLKMTKSITMFFLLSRHAPISAAAFLYHQGSKFSARGLKSAPERSNLTIFEISVNLVRKYFVSCKRIFWCYYRKFFSAFKFSQIFPKKVKFSALPRPIKRCFKA